MKIFQEITKTILLLLLCLILTSRCATIVGGSKYYAEVGVPGHPNASIYYNGAMQGKGYASFKVRRREANELDITIKEKNCEDQTFSYTHRSFRTGAFILSLVLWTGIEEGIPLPWGIALDAITGANWKPSVSDVGVSKEDYKHFNYTIEYTGCKSDTIEPMNNQTMADKLMKLKELLDKNILTQEEFEREKKKILDGQ